MASVSSAGERLRGSKDLIGHLDLNLRAKTVEKESKNSENSYLPVSQAITKISCVAVARPIDVPQPKRQKRQKAVLNLTLSNKNWNGGRNASPLIFKLI